MKYLITFYIFLAILSGSSAVLNYQNDLLGGGYRTQRGPLTTNELPFTSIGANLIPDGNNTRDIGAFGNAWKDLFVSGTAYISQLSIIDSATSTGNIKPADNNSYDLGGYDNAWRNIYVSSTSFLGSVTSTMITPSVNDISDLGDYGLAWNNLFVSSTSFLNAITVDGNITPTTNNSRNLGAFSNAWQSIYASSTLFLGSVTSTMIEPWINNVSNLGSLGKAWKDVYASGTLRVSGNIQLKEGQGLFLDEDLDTKIFANGDDVIRLFAGGGNKLTVGVNSIEAIVKLTPNNNAAKDLGAYGKAWMNLFVSSTSFLSSVTSTMIEPWANNISDLGSYGKAWNGLFVSSSSHLSKCHIQLAASTTQAIAIANVPQEVLWEEIEDEHCDWTSTDGTGNATTTIPRDGSYQMMYCFSPRLSNPPAGRTFEYALFEDSFEHPYSGAPRSIDSSNSLGRTCSMHHGEFVTGVELTIKFSGNGTNVELGATSTVFVGPMPSASWDIWEVDGL